MDEWNPEDGGYLQGVYGVERQKMGPTGSDTKVYIEDADGKRWRLRRDAEVELTSRDPEIGQDVHVRFFQGAYIIRFPDGAED